MRLVDSKTAIFFAAEEKKATREEKNVGHILNDFIFQGESFFSLTESRLSIDHAGCTHCDLNVLVANAPIPAI